MKVEPCNKELAQAYQQSKNRNKDINKSRSDNNDFVLIESDEHKRLLALYHAIYKEREESTGETERSVTKAFHACNLFYLG